jgi:hypothetical protein
MNCVTFLAENEREKLDELRAAAHRRIPNLFIIAGHRTRLRPGVQQRPALSIPLFS